MENDELRKWLRARDGLEAVTLGQLMTLMNLVSAESVEQVGQAHGKVHSLAAGGVNARQKLHRLDTSLQLGSKLLRREGKNSRPSETGIRVAGEFRIFLQGLRAISTPQEVTQTWVIGSGETWIQSLLMPTVVRMAKRKPHWRWDVRNLRTAEIRTGLRDGVLHFGFMRAGEVPAGMESKEGFQHDSYTIVAGDAADAPQTSAALLRWLVKERRAFVQQASTWSSIRPALIKAVPALGDLGSINIQIGCQNHIQAAESARTQGTWCIVPSVIGHGYVGHCATAVIKIPADPMVLAYNDRFLSKHVNAGNVVDELSATIVRQIHTRK